MMLPRGSRYAPTTTTTSNYVANCGSTRTVQTFMRSINITRSIKIYNTRRNSRFYAYATGRAGVISVGGGLSRGVIAVWCV